MSISSSVCRRPRGIGTSPSGTAGDSNVARELGTSLIPLTPPSPLSPPSPGPLGGAVRRDRGLWRVRLLAGRAAGLARRLGPAVVAGPGRLAGLLVRRRLR